MREMAFRDEFESLYFFYGNTPHWQMADFHFHKQYELILFLNDGLSFEIDNSQYEIKRGDLFQINNREYHRANITQGEMYSRYVLMFDPDIPRKFGEVFEYDFLKYYEHRPLNFVHKINLHGSNLEKITHLYEKVGNCMNHKNEPNNKVRLELALLELLITVNEMFDFFHNEKKPDLELTESALDENKRFHFDEVLHRARIDSIKKYIHDNIYEKLDLETIAGEFYISTYYLSHYFKKATGFTVLQYITNQKIIKAKQLLKEGMTVTEVSNCLSYNSDSHFISVFKKSTGITPKRYVKENGAY